LGVLVTSVAAADSTYIPSPSNRKSVEEDTRSALPSFVRDAKGRRTEGLVVRAELGVFSLLLLITLLIMTSLDLMVFALGSTFSSVPPLPLVLSLPEEVLLAGMLCLCTPPFKDSFN